MKVREPRRCDPADRRALVVVRDAATRKRLGQVLKVVFSDLTMREDADAVRRAEGHDMVLIDFDGLSRRERAEAVEALTASRREVPFVVLSSSRGRDEHAEIFASRGITNLVAKNLDRDVHELVVTIQKLLRGDIFGVEKYFSWGADARVVRVSRSGQRGDVLAAAERYASAFSVSPRIVSAYCAAVDEMIANALYDAPIDAEGRHRYAHLPRNEEAALGEGEEVVVKFCCDGARLGVSITDPFGSVTRGRVLDYLARCYRRDHDQIDEKPGGAGIGLYCTFNALSHFILNIAPARKTEVIGLLALEPSYRRLVERGKSFNIFVAR